MRSLMPVKLKLQTAFILLLILAGLVPIFYFITVEIGIARATSGDSTMAAADPAELDRFVENVAFGTTEKLTFDINYGFINAGSATMEVLKLIEYESRPCYQIVTRATSNEFFSTFYKVDDRVESVVDALGLFSWRFEKNLREGGYRADRQYTFDQRNQKVFYKSDTLDVPSYVQDPLSALYYIRTQNLEVGRSIYVDNFTDGKQYQLEVKVIKKNKSPCRPGLSTVSWWNRCYSRSGFSSTRGN